MGAVEGCSSENQNWVAMKNWRDVQKEKERERRRMRDRERRQSMSQEERERHLARRRRNYQLRRERASFTVAPPPPHFDLITDFHKDDDENLQAMVIYNEVPQLECANKDHERLLEASPSTTNNPLGGIIEEGTARVKYHCPKGLRFCQIRHLARLLNCPSCEVRSDDQHVGSQVIAKSCDIAAANKCKLWTRIRLIDLKRLARALNSAPKGLAKKTISALYSPCDRER